MRRVARAADQPGAAQPRDALDTWLSDYVDPGTRMVVHGERTGSVVDDGRDVVHAVAFARPAG